MTKMNPLSQVDLARMGITSPAAASKMKAAAGKVVKGKPLGGESEAPAFELSEVFAYQSYFDNAFEERALFRQSPNELIVGSTLSDPIQVGGYALALHPSSETPVAVQFETGAQQGASPTYRLKPGQMIRPEGRLFENGQFGAFRWGLPFGWLGGGSATLVLLRSADAQVNWATDHNEIVYHRIRQQIWDPLDPEFPANSGSYTGPYNWPQRFPWTHAVFGVNALTQRGQPALAVQPTRTAMSLRLTELLAQATMRIYFIGADVWASGSPGPKGQTTISLQDVRAMDYSWGSWAQQAGTQPPFDSAFQTDILTGQLERYAANEGAILLASTDPVLIDAYVDFVRWGRL